MTTFAKLVLVTVITYNNLELITKGSFMKTIKKLFMITWCCRISFLWCMLG